MLFSFLIAVALAAPPAADLESTLAEVARYEHGQSRAALVELAGIVGESLKSPEQAKALEARFGEFLKSPATLAGKDAICRHLSIIGTEASVPVLSGMLLEADTSGMALYALERIRGAAVDNALRKALPRSSAKTRIGIINTLGLHRDAQSVPAFAKLLASSDAGAAEAAAAALGHIADAEAAGALAKAARGTTGGLRTRVLDAYLDCAGTLAKFGDTKRAVAIYRELNAPSYPETVRIAALGGIAATTGKDAVPALAAALGSGSPHIGAAAIRFLNGISGPEVTSKLMGAEAKAAPALRVQLIAALASRGDKAALPAVLAATKNENEAVRAAAFDAIGALGDSSAVQSLAEAAANASEAEQAAARNSLYRLRGAGVDDAVVAAAGQASGKVRIELIRACGERGIGAASEMLLKAAADSDRETRREALKALRETAGAPQVPAILALLASSKASAERREAERVLSSALRRSDNSTIQDVLAAYQGAGDPETRASLLLVMGQTGHTDALTVLRGALKDGAPELKRAAILGLSDWPTAEPLEDLLALAKEPQSPAHQVLALRGYIKLAALPAKRTPDDTARLLATALGLASQADEKKAVLALLPKYASPEALKVAEGALNDEAVGKEAKIAADRIKRLLAEN